MTVLYIGLGITNAKNIRKCISTLKMFALQSLRDNPHDIMLPGIKLKSRIL